MARRRKGRKISGVLILDKPSGMSSNAALQKAKWIFEAAKAGHTGSLDPLATGVLPICFGEATKFSQFLLDADKSYITRASFGAVSTTGDSEGELEYRDRESTELSEALLEKHLAKFRGMISQVPPMYSALKYKGQPLYKLAREGKTVDIKPRAVNIHELSLLALSEEAFTCDLQVCCSKGTYIRSLVQDIGESLGCGAYVSMLRRISSGGFQLSHAISLTQLEELKDKDGICALDDLLLPTSVLVSAFPEVSVACSQAKALLHGQPVHLQEAQWDHLRGKSGVDQLVPGQPIPVKMFGPAKEAAQGQQGKAQALMFIGMGELDGQVGSLRPKRLLSQQEALIS